MDLVKIGFQIQADGIKEANKEVDKLLDKVGGISEVSKKSSAEVEKSQKKTQKAIKDTEKVAGDAADKILQKQKLIGEGLANGLTRGQASIVASMKMAGGEISQVNDLVEQLNKNFKLMGGKDPFDSSIGSISKVNNDVKNLIVQFDALQRGIQMSKKELREISQLRIQAEARGSSKEDIARITEEYLQQANIRKSLEATINSSVAAEKRLADQSAKKLSIEQQIEETIKRQERFQSLRREGLNRSQANKVISLEATGVSPELIEGFKKAELNANALTKELGKTKKEVDGFGSLFKAIGDVGVRAFSDIHAEAIQMNKAYDKTQEKIKQTAVEIRKLQQIAEMQKQGFSSGSASAIVNFANMQGVTSQQVENFTKLRQQIDNMKDASEKATPFMKNMFSTMSAFFGVDLVYGAIELAKNTFLLADAMQALEARIKLVAVAGEDVAATQDRLFAIAQDTRQPVNDLITLYTRLSAALKNTSFTNADAEIVTKAFGQTLLLSGTTAREAAASILQFSQALASGKLAGDEFRSVSEANPALLRQIAEGAGVARSELKAMSAEGKLTTVFITEALKKQAEAIDSLSKGIPVTFQQGVVQLRNSFIELVNVLNDSLGVTSGVADILQDVRKGMESVTAAAKANTGVIAAVATGFKTLFGVVDNLLVSYAAFRVAIIGLTAVKGFYTAAVGAATVATAANTTAVGVSTVAYGALTVAASAAARAITALLGVMLANPITMVATALSLVVAGLYAYSKSADDATESTENAIASLSTLSKQRETTANSLRFEQRELQQLMKLYPEVYNEQMRGQDYKKLTEDQAKAVENLKNGHKEMLADIKDTQPISVYNQALSDTKKIVDDLVLSFQKFNLANNIEKAIGIDPEEMAKLKKTKGDLQEVVALVGKGYKKEVAETIVTLMGGATKMQETLAKSPEGFKTAFNAAKKEATELFNLEDSLREKKKEKEKDIPKEKDQYAQRIRDLTRVLELSGSISDKMVRDIVLEEEYGKRYEGRLDVAKKIADLQKKVMAEEYNENSNKELAIAQETLRLMEQGIPLEQASAAAQAIKNNYVREEIALNSIRAKLNADQQIQLQNNTFELIRQNEEYRKTQQAIQNIGTIIREEILTQENPFKALEGLDLSKLFGERLNPFDDVLNGINSVIDRTKDFQKQMSLLNKDDARRGALQKAYTKDQLKNYATITGAAKGFFKEGSRGYKTLETAEKTFRAFELAEALANFAVKTGLISAETLAYITGTATKTSVEGGFTVFTVAQKGIQAAASGIAALASSMVGLPFPLNLAAFAATGAVLASIGVAIGGKGGKKSGSFKGSEAKTTGTVFGDKTKESESIKNSIEQLKDIAKIELPITSSMLRHLRSIDNGINGIGNLITRAETTGNAPGQGLAASIPKSGKGSTADIVSGLTGVVSLLKTASNAVFLTGIGGTIASGAGAITGVLGSMGPVGIAVSLAAALIPSIGEAFDKILGKAVPVVQDVLNKATFGLSDALVFKPLGKIFGSIFGKTKVSVKNQGLFAGKQSLEEIFENGFDLKEFVDIKIKKKSLFGSSTKYKTIFSDTVSKELENQFTLVFLNFANSAITAGAVLNQNLDEVTKKLLAFEVDIGKISLKGLSTAKVNEKLQAIFNRQGDLIAESLYGTVLEPFQKVGEGMFETMIRVVSGVEEATVALRKFGLQVGGLESVGDTQGNVGVELVRAALMKSESSQVAVQKSMLLDTAGLSKSKADKLIAEATSALVASGALNIQNLGFAVGTDSQKVLQGRRARLSTAANIANARFGEDLLGVEVSRVGKSNIYTAIYEQAKSDAEILYTEMETVYSGIGQIIQNASVESVEQLVQLAEALYEVKDGIIATGNGFRDVTVSIIQGAGDLERLKSGLDSFFEDFLTGEEQLSEMRRRMVIDFGQLGIALPQSRDEFKNLVRGIDTTTAAGQELFGALISLSPQFSDYISKLEEVAESTGNSLGIITEAIGKDLVDAAKSLYETIRDARIEQFAPEKKLDVLLSEYQSLVNQANQATGTDLVDKTNAVNEAIGPLLEQIKNVYASGPQAQSLIDSVLGQGTQVADRAATLAINYQDESLRLLQSQVRELEAIRIAIQGGGASVIASAKGNIFTGGNVVPFADGGVFTNKIAKGPSMAPMALFGEAGPEAIMPLARGSNGSLGVRIVGAAPNAMNSFSQANGVVEKLAETNRHMSALVTLQQAANQMIIARLESMEDKLDGLDTAARLQASA